MSVPTVRTWGLLLLALLHTSQVTLSHIEMCMKTFYLSEGVCKPCPAHCDICTNATHCTLCQMSYYSQLCENECEEGCAGTCHKVYGHCTLGCDDGDYPDVNSLACLHCRKECKVCRSLTSCVECHTGYYGESCRKTCSGYCKGSLCNTTDGTCFECKDGSYKADGDCVVCPDGCAQCTDNHTCTVCNDGFIGIIDGRCLLECPNIYGDDNVPICGTGLCINQSAHWNIPISECQQAMEHLPNCFTEGVCATLEISLFNLKQTSHSDSDNRPIYRTFKCSLECDEQATRTLTGRCEGLKCKDICELQETAYNNNSEYRRKDTLPKTWVNSHCNIGKEHMFCKTVNTPQYNDKDFAVKRRSWLTIIIVLVVAVVVVGIVIAIVTCIVCKNSHRRKRMLSYISKHVLTKRNPIGEQSSYPETWTEERDTCLVSVGPHESNVIIITEEKPEHVEETSALDSSLKGKEL